jgi:PPM family protein phosphatase
MRRLVASGGTDVGRVREGNEDALLLRDSVFAVADGMGGHLAGEVASATALEPIERLDGRVFSDATEAATALTEAVVAANATVSKLAEDNPSYRGMGTTLTAVMVEGRRLHVAHVGDSRAYLLRDGQFSQLTDDHTLVQHLVNEGQITREEAATHPQRSIITRAIGVSPEVEVDAMSLDLDPGDQLLLCSDGLTGVVEDTAIAGVLTEESDADVAVQRLIELANAGGGPDNITVVLLRYEDPDAPAKPKPATTPDRAPIHISSRDDTGDGDWAGRLGAYGALARGGPADRSGDDQEAPQAGRILARAVTIVVALAVVGGLVVGGGQFLLSRSYFVGLADREVVIYQGVDASIGPLDLARVVERSELTLEDIPQWYHPSLEAGRTAADLSDARRIVETVPLREDEDEDDQAAETGDTDDTDDDADEDVASDDPDAEEGADSGGGDGDT